jgi:hypothetical protein
MIGGELIVEKHLQVVVYVGLGSNDGFGDGFEFERVDVGAMIGLFESEAGRIGVFGVLGGGLLGKALILVHLHLL